MTESVFTLDGVTVRIDGRAILHPLSVDLPAGRVLGLLGHNGSGKSTLMKVLARQLEPSGGTARLFGRSIASPGPRAFARTVAYLPQHTPDTDGLTVAELAALGRFPWHGALGRFGETDRERVAAALRSTDTERLAGRAVDTLSGGERQRAFLAMLVAQDARCLLLDEPIAALDVAQQLEVMRLVRGFCEEAGRSVLVVLHDLNIAARFCDEILMLADGRLAARGTPAALMKPARLHALYGVPMGVFPHPETGTPVSYVL